MYLLGIEFHSPNFEVDVMLQHILYQWSEQCGVILGREIILVFKMYCRWIDVVIYINLRNFMAKTATFSQLKCFNNLFIYNWILVMAHSVYFALLHRVIHRKMRFSIAIDAFLYQYHLTYWKYLYFLMIDYMVIFYDQCNFILCTSKIEVSILENTDVNNQILRARRYYYFDKVFIYNKSIILTIYFKV